MRHLLLLAALFASLALGCSCSTETAGSDSGPRIDVDAGDADVPRDASAIDAAIDAAMCAAPTAGTAAMEGSCGTGSTGGFATQVGILLQPGGGARMRVTGRILGARPCDVVDTIDVLYQGSMIATLDAGHAVAGGLAADFVPWAEGAVDPSVASLCSDEMHRFDGASLVVHTRTDGGTRTLRCGADTGERVVLTCHQGIDPATPSSVIQQSTTDGRTHIQAWFESIAGQDITHVDAAVHVLRGAGALSTPLAPVDVTGFTFEYWRALVEQPGGPPEATLGASAPGQVLGSDCPMAPVMPPPLPPALIARLTGTTSSGPFSTELYAELCFTGP